MANNQVPSQARMEIVAALKSKYLGSRIGGNAPTTHLPPDTTHNPPTQEVSRVEAPSGDGEEDRAGTIEARMVQTVMTDATMQAVEAHITASLKPSLMTVDQVPSPLTPNSYQRNRGRWFAVVMRIEFDPTCLSLDYYEKAKLAGLIDICGDDKEDLITQYTAILNDREFVASRKTALEGFESEMDIPTAVCIATAARTDPHFAVIRRRLRQMDERYRTGGDQKEQFGKIQAFLQGDSLLEDTDGKGIVGNLEESEDIEGGAEYSEESI